MATHPTLPIIYEDNDLLVIDKPAGLLTHPVSAKRPAPSIVDWAIGRVESDESDHPGIVHRLDRDTSGLLIIAKNPSTKTYLQQLFREHKVQKTYLALVSGQPKPPAAIIDLPISRSTSSPAKRRVALGGRSSRTSYQTVKTFPGYSLVELKPQTGRTHQIRVHLAHVGNPLAGDQLYNQGRPQPPGLKRQFLHASRLRFVSPSGQKLDLSSSLPADLQAVLDEMDGKS